MKVVVSSKFPSMIEASIFEIVTEEDIATSSSISDSRIHIRSFFSIVLPSQSNMFSSFLANTSVCGFQAPPGVMNFTTSHCSRSKTVGVKEVDWENVHHTDNFILSSWLGKHSEWFSSEGDST